ncbi:STAS domain-containing protein [Streptomyces sp. NBC_00878]|uniref:STAS domain-containing protein n=1 Tax=Streptomyces sp. NBC_00878 TaxID=2975854 RepID=UPI0022538BA0|nr:STAS domain-containing protein [Streptomyces sp. NBC_00878]MCX4904035.1 STAS domain-containing protein [Streptomyces sp. NBC_00878]
MNETPIHPPSCLRERLVGRTTVVELLGEIDVLTAPVVSSRLDVLTCVPYPELVVDLRRVIFIDCIGLSALCRARNRAVRCGGRVRLVVSSPRVLRMLRAVRLTDVFDVLPALPDVTSPVGTR